jgi:hypothetical protein
LDFEQAIEYFSIFGAIEVPLEFDYFANLFESIQNLVENDFEKLESSISPEYILKSPYREILIAAARGDGRVYALLKKAKISETLGEKIIEELVLLGVIYQEHSREYIHDAKRGYRVQSKVRFVKPFYRFWFGFIEPYRNAIGESNVNAFMEYFQKGYERLRSLVFEQLSNEILEEHFSKHDPIISHGSYWDKDNEFDIISITKSGKVIFGECKYKNRKVCKNELTKLIVKSQMLQLKPDIFVLFSKQGFSNELTNNPPKDVMLFNLEDIQQKII